MAEQYVIDTSVAFSNIPEATFNTALTDAGDYTGAFLDPVPLFIPQAEQQPILGNTEFAADYCNGYFAPLGLSINPVFNFTGFAGRFGLQAHGGAVTAAQQGGTSAYKHSNALQTAATLKGRSMAIKNGTYDFLFAGNAVDTYRLEQVGGQTPVCTVGLVGTSKYTTAVPFSIPAASAACSVNPTTAILITDAYDTGRDLYAANVYSWNMELNNGADATSDKARSAADSSQGPSGGTAKYPGRILRSRNRTVALNVVVPFEVLAGASKSYWEQHLKRSSITSVTLRLRGDNISGSYYYQIDWTIADARLTSTPLSNDDGIVAYNLTFTPVHNATPITFAVTNVTTANYA